MNILVVGAGRIGRQLAEQLFAGGHDVSVVDPSPERLAELSDDFVGFTVSGVAIDSDVLRRAGIEGCDLLAAVTDDDNVNVMVAQMAKEIFSVGRVVTLITDPRRREVFDQFGLNTVCQTSLTVSALESIVLGQEHLQATFYQGSTLSLQTTDPKDFVGKRLHEVTTPPAHSLVGLLRHDGEIYMAGDTGSEVITAEDKLIFAKLID